MNNELILLQDYCTSSRSDLEFILLLESEGLITIEIRESERYLHVAQLANIGRFSHLYYDLAVNVEGIDIINNLLEKMQRMERELTLLRRQSGDAFSELDFFIDEF